MTTQRIHDHLANLDWKQARDLVDAVTCTGEGKRIAAALESAGRRHATNLGIAAHRIHGHERDYGEIILFSLDGTWRARRYEIHIPVKVDWDVDTDTVVYFTDRTWRKDALLITSTGDGEGMYPYRTPALAAWNALRWAIIHVGQYRACKEGLVKSVNIGGYYQPADRDEKSLDEYFELGWEVVQPIIEQGLNGPALVARNLVIHWKEDTEPTPEAWELCPNDCDDNGYHARVCGYDIVLPSEEREGEESEYVSDIPDLTDPRPICIQDSVWPRWPYNIPYPPKARTWEYQQAQWAAQEAEKEAVVELLLNKGVEMTNVKVSDVLNECFDSEWFQNLAMKAVDGAVDIEDYRRALADHIEIEQRLRALEQ